MQWLIRLVVELLSKLLPWVAKQSKPTAEDADHNVQTRDKLRKRVKRFWLIGFILLPVAIGGCSVRTIYVTHGTPVRLRETIKDAKVWIKDSDGQVIAGKMDLSEGWYALPLSDQEE